MKKPNGYVLYRGDSQLDGAPIIVIATGFAKAPSNSKTGDMIQTWIIREDMTPTEAVKSGEDSSICGDCPLRGINGKARGCYVTVHQAPLAVYRAYQRGNYPHASMSEVKELTRGRMVRLGSYGDPAAVPSEIWQSLTVNTKGWTGYTHQWKTSPSLKALCMASADTEALRDEAVSEGWRTFRVKTEEMPIMKNEVVCPATTVGLDCATCGACKGSSTRGNKGTIVVNIHGSIGVINAGTKALAAA